MWIYIKWFFILLFSFGIICGIMCLYYATVNEVERRRIKREEYERWKNANRHRDRSSVAARK